MIEKSVFECFFPKAWERFVSSGRTCRLEKCGFNSKDHAEFEVHLLKHKEDLKRRLICNQVVKVLKFRDCLSSTTCHHRKNVELKWRTKRRGRSMLRGTRLSSRPRSSTVSGELKITCRHVVNSCRSVLLYNKHGLLMEAFMREYREACGRPLPFK